MATGGPIRPSTSQVTDSHHQPQDKTTDQSNYLSPAISQAIEPWPQVDFYNNTSIQFEEYHYWADLTREAEKSTRPQEQGLFGLFKRKSHEPREEPAATLAGDSKKEVVTDTTDHSQNIADTLAISDSEWNNARGAMRTATWGKYTSMPCLPKHTLTPGQDQYSTSSQPTSSVRTMFLGQSAGWASGQVSRSTPSSAAWPSTPPSSSGRCLSVSTQPATPSATMATWLSAFSESGPAF